MVEDLNKEGLTVPIKTIDMAALRAETQRVEPLISPDRAKGVGVLIYDPNFEGIGTMVGVMAERAGRDKYYVVKDREQIVDFLNKISGQQNILNLVVINSGSTKRGSEATKEETEELFKPWIDLTNEILGGRVEDENGREGVVPTNIEVVFIAPRDQVRLNEALKKATKCDSSYVARRLKGFGLPFEIEEMISYLGETAKYTIQMSNPEPDITEGDTI